MNGIPIENNGGNKKPKSDENSNNAKELISRNTIFTWRKNTAQEIEYLVKDKQGFYKLYLRNLN